MSAVLGLLEGGCLAPPDVAAGARAAVPDSLSLAALAPRLRGRVELALWALRGACPTEWLLLTIFVDAVAPDDARECPAGAYACAPPRRVILVLDAPCDPAALPLSTLAGLLAHEALHCAGLSHDEGCEGQDACVATDPVYSRADEVSRAVRAWLAARGLPDRAA